MKKYNDIGDLYREKFADYNPEPPVSVWEGLKPAIEKKSPLWKKITYPFVGAVLIGAVVYLIVASPKQEESVMAKVTDNQQNINNQIVSSDVLSIENQSDKSLDEKKTFVLQGTNSLNSERSSEAENIVLSNSSNDDLAETSKIIEESSINSKKTITDIYEEDGKKQNTVKQVQNENPQSRILPIKISKDTTICENATVKLYVYNAENVLWNTGETENSIVVQPSYGEKYSVTFSRTNAKDTTVYIHINVVQCAEVHIPNIFTPNGDGRNDVFLAQTNMVLKSFEMTIYSADGKQVLFTSEDINHGWDGTYRGILQLPGTYFYCIRYTDNLEKSIEKPGKIVISY